MRLRDLLFAGALALGAGALAATPFLDGWRGLSLDVLFWLRAQPGDARPETATAPVVIVAIDEETYRRPPFADRPNVAWTPEIARVLTALVDAGVAVVGFDVIFAASMERLVPGHDRDFLRALNGAARADKVVLGKVQHQEQPILPFEGQRIAVGRTRNLHAVNVTEDADGVIRRVPLWFEASGADGGLRREAAFGLEIAARAAGVRPEPTADGGLRIGRHEIPGAARNALALNFRPGWDALPSYSLADLHACAEKGDGDFFRRHFAGKAVLIGTMLDVEDRKLTSKRLITGAEGPSTAPRCALPKMDSLFVAGRTRDTIPGVMIHATAVANLLEGDAIRELPRWAEGLAGGGLALTAAVVGLLWSPLPAAVAVAVGAVAWTWTATLALEGGILLPFLAPLATLAIAFAVLLGYRFFIADKDKRFLRRMFGLYLSPALVERLAASDKPPALGGEETDVTVFFSDIAGFSTISEQLTPPQLVAFLNEYLTAMSDIVDAHGGYIECYVGDAIHAMFGAPVANPDHALAATRAALACRARLAAMNKQGIPAFRGHAVGQRIGLNTGPVVVGNVGSRRRFNYAMVGDMANLGARLEGANKFYGTTIMASGETADRTGDCIVWRELDQIRVKGRDSPVRILEPLGEAGAVDERAVAIAATYGDGLARWRAKDFAGAAEHFARIAEIDPPAARFLARARRLVTEPPGADWEPVTTLTEK